MDQEQKGKTDSSAPLSDIEWDAPEFEKYEKGPAWFVIVSLIALAFFAVALLMRNFVFAITIIIATLAIFIYALKEPKIVKFKISGQGITIDEKLHAFGDMHSFWIFFEPPQIKEVSIKTKKWMLPLIKIPFDDLDPLLIRQALIKFIPEEKQEMSIVDSIAKMLKF